MYRPLLSAAIAAAFLTTGCVSIGPNYDEAAVERLKPGMTKAEVIAMLGRPSTTVTLADKSQQAMWVHSKGSMFGSKARALTVMFGPDGRYRETVSEARTELR